jgi:hypothetical protein
VHSDVVSDDRPRVLIMMKHVYSLVPGVRYNRSLTWWGGRGGQKRGIPSVHVTLAVAVHLAGSAERTGNSVLRTFTHLFFKQYFNTV